MSASARDIERAIERGIGSAYKSVHPRLAAKAYYVKPVEESVARALEIKLDKSNGMYLKWTCHGGPDTAWGLAVRAAGWGSSSGNSGTPA